MKASDGGWAHGGAAPATHLVADLVLDTRDLLDVLLGRPDPLLQGRRRRESRGISVHAILGHVGGGQELLWASLLLTTTTDDSGKAAYASGTKRKARARARRVRGCMAGILMYNLGVAQVLSRTQQCRNTQRNAPSLARGPLQGKRPPCNANKRGVHLPKLLCYHPFFNFNKREHIHRARSARMNLVCVQKTGRERTARRLWTSMVDCCMLLWRCGYSLTTPSPLS